MADEILQREAEGVLVVTVNRPDKMNALNRTVLTGLREAMEAALARDVHALVITGAGERAFVAGADVKEIRERAGSGGGAGFARFGQAVFRMIEALPFPTIAAINGYALGGGLELAMACDFRVARRTARLGQPEVNLGIIPGYGGTQRLQRLTGRSFALRLILTGEAVSADEARAAGLVDQVVEDDVVGAALVYARPFAGKSRSAVRAAKLAIDGGFGRPLDEALDIEANYFDEALAHPDAVEGTQAFLDKRKPVFRKES